MIHPFYLNFLGWSPSIATFLYTPSPNPTITPRLPRKKKWKVPCARTTFTTPRQSDLGSFLPWSTQKNATHMMTFCGQIILLKSETWNRIQWVGNLIAAAQATYKSSIYQYLSVFISTGTVTKNQGHKNSVLVSSSFKAYCELRWLAFTWLDAMMDIWIAKSLFCLLNQTFH